MKICHLLLLFLVAFPESSIARKSKLRGVSGELEEHRRAKKKGKSKKGGDDDGDCGDCPTDYVCDEITGLCKPGWDPCEGFNCPLEDEGCAVNQDFKAICVPIKCVSVVPCPMGTGCDPTDGVCKDDTELRTSISVVINPYQDVPNQQWATFRSDHPVKPFCLLQPIGLDRDVPPIPTPIEFEADDAAINNQVDRDDEYDTVSDWLHLCGIDGLQRVGAGSVDYHMDPDVPSAAVVESLHRLVGDLANQGMRLNFIPQGGHKDWVSPHI